MKKIRINVTQRDIDWGKVADSECCPIQIAIARRGFPKCSVGTSMVFFPGGIKSTLPQVAQDWEFNYDCCQVEPVKPFSFTLEIPE